MMKCYVIITNLIFGWRGEMKRERGYLLCDRFTHSYDGGFYETNLLIPLNFKRISYLSAVANLGSYSITL